MSGTLKTDDFLNDRYKIINFIDEGGMQYVYLAFDELLKRNVAVKVPKNPSAKKRFKRGAIAAARVNHPNVAKTLDYFEDENNVPYLVEEYIQGNDLDKALLKSATCLDPFLVSKIFHHLAKGLAASHHSNVIHRDLKPTNIMVAGGFQLHEIKITDFGIAIIAGDEIAEALEGGEESISSSKTAVGALPYMSPEAIQTPKDVTTKTDIWSLGAMMYELLAGHKPFGGGWKVVHNIIATPLPDFPSFVTSKPQFRPLSTQLIKLITLCLDKNPDQRPNADELVNLCSELCYPVTERIEGLVNRIEPPHKAWGFITTEQGNAFFHRDSVYGDLPVIGSRVVCSVFPSFGANRAHPVVVLK